MTNDQVAFALDTRVENLESGELNLSGLTVVQYPKAVSKIKRDYQVRVNESTMRISANFSERKRSGKTSRQKVLHK